MNILLILPNQIFEKSLSDTIKYSIEKIIIVRDDYYINDKVHKQKLCLMFTAIDEYIFTLNKKDIKHATCEKIKDLPDSGNFFMYEILDKEVRNKYSDYLNAITFIPSPSILLSLDDCVNMKKELIGNKNRIKHSDFYAYMRKKMNILIDEEGKPVGGKWSFDTNNRNKFDKNYTEKSIWTNQSQHATENIEIIKRNYPNAYGELEYLYYPSSFSNAKLYFKKFLEEKIHKFGYYQDAIHSDVVYGEHSNISAIMNIGLITPMYVVDETMKYYNSLDKKKKTLILSDIEGFIRQVIGWREYMRFTYELYKDEIMGDSYLTVFDKKIHKSWYSGNTGIYIFDNLIRKALKYGYLHHIERLMLINNAMIMYNFSMMEVYNWFMRLFVDSYDWVMVSCVCMNHNSLNKKFKYMSRVYISSDSYIKRMSNYTDKTSLQVYNSLFKTFVRNNSDLLKRDYTLSAYIARYIKKN